MIPNASKNQIDGWKEEILKIRITTAPEKGEANAALIDFLAETLDIPKSAIQIVSGKSSRLKTLRIEGITQDQIKRLLNKE